jgi:hypothetical protein
MKRFVFGFLFVVAASLAGCGSDSAEEDTANPASAGDAAIVSVDADSGSTANADAAPAVAADAGTNVPANDAAPATESSNNVGSDANPTCDAATVSDTGAFVPEKCEPNSKADCTMADGKPGKKTCAAAGDSYGLCVRESLLTCIKGQTVACQCVGLGMVGAQTCTDGYSWSTCECPTNGTGGSSGSGGAGGSGGVGGSSGTGGSSGSVDAGANTVTVKIVCGRPFPDTGFVLSYYGTKIDVVACTGGAWTRSCVIPIGSVDLDFSIKTGFQSGAGESVPGWDGMTGIASTFDCTVTLSDVNRAFANVSNKGSGYNFRLLISTTRGDCANSATDRDCDGEPDTTDCDPNNPSVHHPITNQTYSPEVCGDGVGSDCGKDTSCVGDGGTGGAGGSSGTGGSSGSSGTGGTGGSIGSTITFEIFDGASWSTPLTMWSYAPTYGYVSCTPMQLADPRDGVSRSAAVCTMNVDRSRVLEFQVQVGSQWLTGYSTPPTCVKYLRAYAFDGPYMVADYDDDPNTYPDPQYAGRHIYDQFLGSTCHVYLPKAP